MVTDDPGTPGNGHWEINIAAIYTASGDAQLVNFPYFDVNYGLGDHLQLKLETGLVILSQNGAAVQTGAGTALAGVKWRFLDQDTAGVSVSTYPQYQFRDFVSSANTLLADPGSQLLLPIELSKEIGRWGINPEVGYLFSTQTANAVIYGLVLAYSPKPDFDLLAEIHGTTRFESEGTQLLLNAGLRYPFSEAVSLLFSLGHTVDEFVGDETQLLGYLGMQLRL